MKGRAEGSFFILGRDGHVAATGGDTAAQGDCEESEAPLPERCRTRIVVPAGFRTDFASIPRLFWPLIGHPAGRYAQAASLHEWLYRNHLVSRAESDRIFHEAMGTLGVPAWKRAQASTRRRWKHGLLRWKPGHAPARQT
jgi:hypothetical protein